MTEHVIFGGTFDPVHNGHIQTAKELTQKLGYEHMTLMPCGEAYHKANDESDAQHRWRMLQLAAENESALLLDDREILRSGPTYTVQTLRELRAELGPAAHIAWVMGQDAAAGLTRWHEWTSLFDLANLIVVARPDEHWPDMDDWPARHMDDVQSFKKQPNGAVFCLSLTPMAISSSLVRQKVKNQQSIDDLVPAQVVNWIQANKLYR